jgi:hypothetical protein
MRSIAWSGIAVAGLTLSASFSPNSQGAQRVPERHESLSYQAEVVQTNQGRSETAVVLYNRGKFRVARFQTKMQHPSSIELYDQTDPILVWAYDPQTRSAYPSLRSSLEAIGRASQRLGEEETRRRYGIPASFAIRRPSGGHPRPGIGHLLVGTFSDLSLKPAGKGTAAGVPCSIFTAVVAPANPQIIGRSPSALEANPSQRFRFWIDAETGLVLRLEHRIEFGVGSPVPPQQNMFLVRRLEWLKAPAPERFRLPPGARAHVPRIFDHVRLPPGVKRLDMTASNGATGLDFGKPD